MVGVGQLLPNFCMVGSFIIYLEMYIFYVAAILGSYIYTFIYLHLLSYAIFTHVYI